MERCAGKRACRMAYVAVSGGEEAIEASLKLLRRERATPDCDVKIAAVIAALPELIDQVMGESSLYDPTLAALALKQGGGSVEEAVFLLRAFRATLERPYTSRIIETSGMHVTRRISAAFKDILGGQILGATRDYSHRLLDFSLTDETEFAKRNADATVSTGTSSVAAPEETGSNAAPEEASSNTAPEEASSNAAPKEASSNVALKEAGRNATLEEAGSHETAKKAGFDALPRVSDYLAEQGLFTLSEPDDTPPHDITMEPLDFPTPRSMRLQALARGMTQAVMALGYAAIRGFGPTHPTVGELRSGTLDILIDHPFQAGEEGDAYYVGAMAVTEVESLFSVESACEPRAVHQVSESRNSPQASSPQNDNQAPSPQNDNQVPELQNDNQVPELQNDHQVPEPRIDHQTHELKFGIGYGLVYGGTESKAIAMSVLDFCLSRGDSSYPTQDEEFVLYHIDGIEATGFLSHLKLPHYVTFQSKLSSARGTHTECTAGDVAKDPTALGAIGSGKGSQASSRERT